MIPTELIDEIILYKSIKEQVEWYFPTADINSSCIWKHAVEIDNLELIKFLYKRKIYILDNIWSEKNLHVLFPGVHHPSGHINLDRYNTGIYMYAFPLLPGDYQPSGQINYSTYDRTQHKIQEAIYKSIELNNLRIYKYLFEKIITFGKINIHYRITQLQEEACSKGAIDIVRFNLDTINKMHLSSAKNSLIYNYVSNAAENGHLNIIKLLHANNYNIEENSAILAAIKGNHLDVVNYLRQNIKKYPNSALEVAIKSSVESQDLKLLEFLVKTGVLANVNSLYCALFAITCNDDSNNDVAYFIYNNFEICRRKESINLCRRLANPYKYQAIVGFFQKIRINTRPEIQSIIDEIMQTVDNTTAVSQSYICECGGICGESKIEQLFD